MIEGWQPKDENVHIYFGQEFHQAFHEYELHRFEKLKHDEALHRVVRNLLIRTKDWDSDNQYKNRRNLVRTVIWYLEEFKKDAAKTFVLETGKLACEVSFRFELDWGPKVGTIETMNAWESVGKPSYLLCGHLDRVVVFNDELFIMDHKTAKSTPGSYYFDQYEPENQMSLYTLAGQVLFNTTIRGVIINVAQVAIDFSRFVRGFTYRTPDQIDEWVNDLHYWFALAEEFAQANYWPMNDTACDKYGGCKFRRICSKSPQVREKFLAADFEKGERWNPLKVR